MSTELVVSGRRVDLVDRETGEIIVDLAGQPTEVVGPSLSAIDDLLRRLRTLRTQHVDRLEQLYREARAESRSVYGGAKLERSQSRRWDAKRTRETLERIAADGVITQERVDACAPMVPVPRPDGRRLNALLAEIAGTEAARDLLTCDQGGTSWKAHATSVDATAEELV